ncbi:MAG: DUF6456 domain-containing protein [Pseudomonadota bacterium]
MIRKDDLRGAAIGILPQATFVSLFEAGDLKEVRKGHFVWAGERMQAGRRPARTPDLRPQSTIRRRTALESVLDTFGDTRARSLASASASRFAGDMERAAYGQRVTQNWDVSLHVDGVSSGRGGGRMESAVAAQRRLDQVHAALNSVQFTNLIRLITQERSLASLAQMNKTSIPAVRIKLSEALIALTESYKLSVSAPR